MTANKIHLHPLKGKKDGVCNRTMCQLPGAVCYNKENKAYYCRFCATLLNQWKLTDGSYLCDIPPVEKDKNDNI